jgi:hypothetical protein
MSIMIIIEKPFSWIIFREQFYVVGCNNTKIYITRNLSNKKPHIISRNILNSKNELTLDKLLIKICNSNKITIDAKDSYPEYFL